MSVELGTGYVSLTVSAKGIKSDIESEMSGITGIASNTGKSAGTALASGFKGSGTAVASEFEKAGSGAGGLTGKLGSLTSSLKGTQGVAGDLRGGIGGLDNVLQGAAGSPLVLAGAVTAIGAAAIGSVKQFEDLGLKIDAFSVATGTTADVASRWVEVADDHGIAAETLQSSIGKMNKTAEASPASFEQYGIAIAHAKDGTVDASGTFLNAVQAIGSIEDPAKQAAAGAAIFGRGWQSMAGLISEGAPKLREDLAAVQPEKIFGQGDIDAAKGVRDGFDSIKDAGEGLFLTLGKSLAPVVAELAPKFGQILTKLTPLIDGIGKGLVGAFEAVEPAIDGVTAIVGPLADALGWVTGQIPNLITAIGGSGDAFKSQKASAQEVIQEFAKLPNAYRKIDGTTLPSNLESLSQTMKDFGISTADLQKNIDKYASSSDAASAATRSNAAITAEGARLTAEAAAQQKQAQGDAINSAAALTAESARYTAQAAAYTAQQESAAKVTEQMAAAQELASAQTAKHTSDLKDNVSALQDDLKAQTDLADAMRSAADAQFDVDSKTVAYKASVDGLDKALKDAKGDVDKQKVAYDGVKESASALADAHVHLREQTDASNGVTTTATQKQDAWNASMLNQATNATPKARQAIIDYIAEANGIPADKATEITAAVKAGDLDTANALLAEASRARTATVSADTDSASLARTNTALDNIAHNRSVNYLANGNTHGFATGTGDSPDTFIAGENGPELVIGAAHSTVLTASETIAAQTRATGLTNLAPIDQRSSTTGAAPFIGHADFHTELDVDGAFRMAQFHRGGGATG